MRAAGSPEIDGFEENEVARPDLRLGSSSVKTRGLELDSGRGKGEDGRRNYGKAALPGFGLMTPSSVKLLGLQCRRSAEFARSGTVC